MTALIIDLKDYGVRTPEQVVRVFFALYDSGRVRAELLGVLMELGEEEEGRKRELAVLFDHLVALCGALEGLRDRTAGACPVCGRG